MNKQLKVITRTVLIMFLVLFMSVTMIQFVYADELRANENNRRTMKNSFGIERGAILVDGSPVAYSVPTQDEFQYMRMYSDGTMFAPATGYFSHYQGMTGVEASMNDALSGIATAQFFTRIMRILTGDEPQGSSVALTLDGDAQRTAYEAMAGMEGAVVALEPNTGKILALVSTPSFDPGLLSTNNDLEIIENYSTLERDPSRPLLNRAIGGDLYHPGSTYKLVTAAAALETGTATPETEFDDVASFPLPQSTAVMQNYSRTVCDTGDKVTLERALALSCNIPFAELAVEMDPDAISSMAAAFGFDQELAIPLTVTPSTSPTPMDSAQAALASIGQLDVRATPLQMAMVSAAIANNGTIMKPQLIDRVIAPDLRVERTYEAEEFRTPISAETAEALASMMELSVSAPDGAAAMSGIDGVRVAGKTGTAENGKDSSGNDLPFTIWYTGFAPAENPEVVVAVVIANGGGELHEYSASSYDVPTVIGKQVMEAVLSQ